MSGLTKTFQHDLDLFFSKNENRLGTRRLPGLMMFAKISGIAETIYTNHCNRDNKELLPVNLGATDE
jgi:hypothetical protein